MSSSPVERAWPTPLAVIAGLGDATALEVLCGMICPSPGYADPLLTADGALGVSASARQTWIVVRHGARHAATAHVPGQRMPRAVANGASDVSGRPPRRIEIRHPAPVLRALSLVCAPQTSAADQVPAEVLLDALTSATALVVVTTPQPFRQDELDLLRQVATAVDRMAFVLLAPSGLQGSARSPDALTGAGRGEGADAARAVESKRAALIRHMAMADATRSGRSGALPPGGPLLEAHWYRSDQLPEVVTALTGWAQAVPPGLPAETRSGCRAPAVVDEDVLWRAVLTADLSRERTAVAMAVRDRCGAIHSRCAGLMCADLACSEMPSVLDRELHALSVAASHLVEGAATRLTARMCGVLLGDRPGAVLLRRVERAARRIAEASEDATSPRALMVTTTAAVAAVTGTAALDALHAIGSGIRESVLPPIGVAVTSSCYHRWRRGEPGDVAACQTWLALAVRGVETAVLHEVDRRLSDFSRALEAVAVDAVEHGFLLT